MSSFIYSFIGSTHFELKENFISVKELSKNKIINIKEITRQKKMVKTLKNNINTAMVNKAKYFTNKNLIVAINKPN